jgi:subtilisin family serine protease
VWRYELATRDGHDALAIAAKLAQREETEFAELDCIISGGGTVSPNDPLFGECWGLNNIGQSGGTPDIDMDVLEAWDITTGSNNIIVLVMDTGTDLAHPDMPVAFGRDFTGAVPSSGGPQNTCDSHGTAVAGCISALVNNNTGAAGVAPGTRLATARPFVSNSACDGSWSAAFSWTADALEWGRGLGARVSNNSNYFGGTSSIVTAKYNDTYATGMVHFASAGNNNNATIVYPANIPVVNAVMAITRTGARASFSSFGVGVDFAAPGVAIRTTDRVSSLGYSVTDYALVNGTSFASPYAAGVAALLLSQNPSLTPAEVETAMRNTAMDLGSAGYDTTFGYGLVRALAALQAVGACDDIDFNNDGLFPDDTDLLDFLSVLAGGTCSTGACNDIDFNNDSLFPDDADLLAFLSVLAGQACN